MFSSGWSCLDKLQVPVVIRETEGGRGNTKKTTKEGGGVCVCEKTNRNLKATASHWCCIHTKYLSHSTGCLPPLCPARPTEIPPCQALVKKHPSHCQSKRRMYGFHPQPSLVAGLTFLAARKGAQRPSFAILSAFPGHIFCLK